MNMKSPLWFCLVLPIAASVLADVTDDVRCHEIGFSRSVEIQDADLFVTFIDADARFVGSTVARGPAAVAEAWSVFFSADGPAIMWRPHIVEVLEDGKLALSRGPYKMTTTDDAGKSTDHWGTFNSIWRLQDDGSWKVVFDAGSPASEAPGEEIQALLETSDTCVAES